MTSDQLIAVKVRLDTASVALQSALGEAAQPHNERDGDLMECLLTAVRHTHDAQMMCNTLLEAVTDLDHELRS